MGVKLINSPLHAKNSARGSACIVLLNDDNNPVGVGLPFTDGKTETQRVSVTRQKL